MRLITSLQTLPHRPSLATIVVQQAICRGSALNPEALVVLPLPLEDLLKEVGEEEVTVAAEDEEVVNKSSGPHGNAKLLPQDNLKFAYMKS